MPILLETLFIFVRVVVGRVFLAGLIWIWEMIRCKTLSPYLCDECLVRHIVILIEVVEWKGRKEDKQHY